MQQQETEALLYAELEPEERIIWSGKPAQGAKNSNSPTVVFIILASVFGGIGIAMLVVGFILLSIGRTKDATAAMTVMLILGGTFFSLAIMFSLFAIFLRFPLSGLTYAITDRRIISINSGNMRVVTSYGKADISSITRLERQDGTGDILFGQNKMGGSGYNYGYQYNASGTSTNTYGPRTSGALRSSGSLIGIPNVREVEHIILRTFKL